MTCQAPSLAQVCGAMFFVRRDLRSYLLWWHAKKRENKDAMTTVFKHFTEFEQFMLRVMAMWELVLKMKEFVVKTKQNKVVTSWST